MADSQTGASNRPHEKNVEANAPERWRVKSRMWESRLSGSERALREGEMNKHRTNPLGYSTANLDFNLKTQPVVPTDWADIGADL